MSFVSRGKEVSDDPILGSVGASGWLAEEILETVEGMELEDLRDWMAALQGLDPEDEALTSSWLVNRAHIFYCYLRARGNIGRSFGRKWAEVCLGV